MTKLLKGGLLYNYLILTISIFFIEVINKLIMGSDLLSFSMVRIFVSISIFSLIISLLLNFTNKVVSKIINLIFVFLMGVYSCAQAGFNNFLGVYISFQTSSQLGAVTDYIKDFILSFKPYYYCTFIPFIILVLFYIIVDRKVNVKFKDIRLLVNRFICYFFLIFLIMTYYLSIAMPCFQSSMQTISNMDLFMTAANPSLCIEQYGVFGFFFLDVKALIHPVELSKDYSENFEYKQEELNENSRIIADEAWLNLIDKETNNTYNEINKYLISRDITEKNEYTGLFKDKNLIIIMMESANDIFINPEYYPNFYKLVTEGWYFKNNYSPRNSCATMNNEFSGMTSLYSVYNTCTASKYKNNQYYTSVFNMFNNIGYTTFSAHDYINAYYPRKTIHTSLGSQDYYGAERLKISYSGEYVNWANDDEFMEAVLKVLDNKTTDGNHFMTWLTTVSAHQPYSVSSIQGDKYYNMTKNTGYPTEIRRYMSKLKFTDDAIGVLLNGLEERGILDDTVIVLFGDHYPYGISKQTLNKVMDIDNTVNLNADRVPFVIYNSTLEAKEFEQYTSYINILPTLANLFDLSYDPRLYLGSDLLSKDYQSLVIFADGSWKNEIAYYNATKMKATYFGSKTYTDEELRKINEDVDARIAISSKIIKNNYINYLDNALKEEKAIIDSKKGDMCLLTDIAN